MTTLLEDSFADSDGLVDEIDSEVSAVEETLIEYYSFIRLNEGQSFFDTLELVEGETVLIRGISSDVICVIRTEDSFKLYQHNFSARLLDGSHGSLWIPKIQATNLVLIVNSNYHYKDALQSEAVRICNHMDIDDSEVKKRILLINPGIDQEFSVNRILDFLVTRTGDNVRLQPVSNLPMSNGMPGKIEILEPIEFQL